MPAAARLAPRKKPRQSRSTATVESILTAAARVLVRHGYQGASTNRIAEAAGVSVGSLYQYFPSKEAIVLALFERHCEQIGRIVENALLAEASSAVPDVVRSLVRGLLEAHRASPELHAVLTEQVPLIAHERHAAMQARVEALVRLTLRARASEVRALDPDLAAFVLVNAVDGLMHKAILEPRPGLPLEAIADEVATLVLRYLLPAEHGRKGR
jgi:AcrR family transcriptional regulator